MGLKYQHSITPPVTWTTVPRLLFLVCLVKWKIQILRKISFNNRVYRFFMELFLGAQTMSYQLSNIPGLTGSSVYWSALHLWHSRPECTEGSRLCTESSHTVKTIWQFILQDPVLSFMLTDIFNSRLSSLVMEEQLCSQWDFWSHDNSLRAISFPC